LAIAAARMSFTSEGPAKKKPSGGKDRPARDPSLVLVTGYCNCGKCCGWKRSWFGFGAPV
jgi:hypothetical protein